MFDFLERGVLTYIFVILFSILMVFYFKTIKFHSQYQA